MLIFLCVSYAKCANMKTDGVWTLRSRLKLASGLRCGCYPWGWSEFACFLWVGVETASVLIRTQRSVQFHGEQSLLSERLRQLLNVFSLLCFSSFRVKRFACCFLSTPAVSVSPCLRTNKCSELALCHRATLEQLFLGVSASEMRFF